MRDTKGITLIALIITIIILLILAAVTMSLVFGENGIINRTQYAKSENEKKAMQENIKIKMLEIETEKELGNIEDYLGEELIYDSTTLFYSKLSVYDFEENIRYKEGWYLLEPEDDFLGYIINGTYLINYKTGEVLEVSDQDRYYIARGGNVCITENLVYTVDSTNIGQGDNWGDMILHNFNTDSSLSETLHSGWTREALLFDGKDDGFEKADNTDYTKGVTLEIFFRMEGKTESDIREQVVQILFMKRSTTSNGFFMAVGNKANSADALGYQKLMIDIGGSTNRVSDIYRVPENEDIYLTYTFDQNTKTGILYVNGMEYYRTNKGDTKDITSSLTAPIQIGADVYQTNGAGYTYPLFGRIYASRVYNTALTENEVKYNYTSTTGIEL